MQAWSLAILHPRERFAAPSPPYSGERVGVRGERADASSCAACNHGPSPQPSPLSTGERGSELQMHKRGAQPEWTYGQVTLPRSEIFPAPSPPYSGERVGVRGEWADASNCAVCNHGPSPQPSPLSTGERESELQMHKRGAQPEWAPGMAQSNPEHAPGWRESMLRSLSEIRHDQSLLKRITLFCLFNEKLAGCDLRRKG